MYNPLKYLLLSGAILAASQSIASTIDYVPVFKITPAKTSVVMAPGSNTTLDFTVSNNMNVDLKVTNIKPFSSMSNLNASITATCTGTTLTANNGNNCSVTASITAANVTTKSEGFFDITACIDGGAHCSASIVKAKFTIDPNAPVNVGDRLDGGTVACTVASGGHFNLIATVTDKDGGAGTQWSSDTTNTTGATSNINGQTNTTTIQGGTYPDTSEAIYICANLSEGGFSDWYLPAKDELNCLFTNKGAIGGFAPTLYRSSTEANANFAWSQGFFNGYQVVKFKNFNRRVRCVRAFTP